MQRAQPAGAEPGGAGRAGLHRGADALQRAQAGVPRVGHADRVGRDEAQRRAARERLPQPQPGAHAVGLGRRGGLADQLLAPRLRRQGDRARPPARRARRRRRRARSAGAGRRRSRTHVRMRPIRRPVAARRASRRRSVLRNGRNQDDHVRVMTNARKRVTAGPSSVGERNWRGLPSPGALSEAGL